MGCLGCYGDCVLVAAGLVVYYVWLWFGLFRLLCDCAGLVGIVMVVCI